MASLIKLIRKTYHMAGPQESNVVLSNVTLLSGLQLITYLLPIIIIPYLFRVLGPSKFGLIAFAQAFVQYFMIITDYGFSVTATKDISLCHTDKEKVREVFSSVMTVKILLTALSLGALSALVYFVPKFRNDWLVYALSFGMVVGNTLFPTWFFQGMERMKYIANLNIVGEFIYAAAIFFFVKEWQDYLLVPLINSAVFLTVGILGQYIVWRRFGVVFKPQNFSHIRKQLLHGWNVFISVVAINAYTNTRVFAVGLLTNNTMTGFYSIAEKIANVAQTFPLSAFSQAIFPRLSKIFHKNKVKAFLMMQQIQHITIMVSVICLPVIFIFSPFIVRVACGGDYPTTVMSLRLLLISVFLIASNAFRVQFLLVCGRTELYSMIHVTVALIGLPLIFLLIYSFSYVGAALATVFIEGGIFTITYFTVRGLSFSNKKA